ncbi:MAG: hypothetical protein GX072_14955 [Lysinibacillus sp.]|nr:hypothetical protein [Lysinibacillus sp.]
MANSGKRFTQTGTDIEEVKRQNAQGSSGSFGTNPQKVREEIAQEGGFAAQGSQGFSQANQAGKTASGTDIQKVREEIAQESGFASQGQGMAGQQKKKTITGTDIQEVKRQNQNPSQ